MVAVMRLVLTVVSARRLVRAAVGLVLFLRSRCDRLLGVRLFGVRLVGLWECTGTTVSGARFMDESPASSREARMPHL